MNELAYEKSPYLLQHAGNPVHWRPWGQPAFDAAVREDKPIFLSIGYSTCHWCHVMAHESFEDEAAAEALNRDFIPVKVDREERPDVDAVYMAACVALNGSGGWPLTLLLTPDRKPFWAGTYLPKNRLLSLLALAYTEAFGHTRRPIWREIACRTLDYVLRELMDPLGGFYCGQDADSEGVEGKYYLLTPEDVSRALDRETAGRFCRRFDITPRGNFQGKSVPNLIRVSDWESEPAWAGAARERLYAYRREPRPNLTVLVKTPKNAEKLGEIAPFTAEYPIPATGAKYYLCRGGVCQSPAEHLDALEKQWREAQP